MIRRALFAFVAALVALPLLDVAPSTAAAPDCRSDLSASALNGMIRGGARTKWGIVGMDYAHVHHLPDGRVLWLFQDAYVGSGASLGSSKLTHNVGVIQFGSCVKLLRSGTKSKPRSWIGSSSETLLRRWFWPLDGVMGADGRFQQFVVEMRNPNGTGAARGATPVRVWIASIRLSDLRVMSFKPAPDDRDLPLFGFSIASDDSWTYLYGNCYRQFTNPSWIGSHDLACSPQMYVARVPKGKVFDAPQYWSGADWVGGRSDAKPVMVRGLVANPMQVRNVGGTFVSVTKIDDWWGSRAYVDVAPAATGPWTQVADFGVDQLCDRCNTYFAHLLPWRDNDGSMLVAISNNVWDARLSWQNSLLYRPRIMSVRAPDGIQLPPPPADCAINRTLRFGSKGVDVTCLRRRLAALGQPVDANGSKFDASVQTALKAIQLQFGLDVDGICGPNTGKRLGIRGGRTVTP